MPTWTKEQQAAISGRNQKILVSAAAGSGKTAVLVERIVSLIRDDHMDIDRMLVVTFTRAAASEMKERIRKALSQGAEEDENLRLQLQKLDRASISTLHVFCGKVQRDYFHLVEADPMARLCEGAEREGLFQEALTRALESFYGSEEGDDIFMAEAFTDEDIETMVRELYTFLMAQGSPWEWLSERKDGIPQGDEGWKHPWLKTLCDDLAVQGEGLLHMAKENEAWCHAPEAFPSCVEVALDDVGATEALVSMLRRPTAALSAMAKDWNYKKLSAPRNKTPEEETWYRAYQNRRKRWKKGIDTIRHLIPLSIEKTAADANFMVPCYRALERLVRNVYLAFRSLKGEANVYDFHDLEHNALAILQQEGPRAAVQGQYDALFIDEYQDISGIQEAILDAVGEDRLVFYVGDVKQSIYRFRLADPSLFMGKYRHFSKGEESGTRRIDLQKNFRSAGNILHCVNQVFESVMLEEATELQYDEDAMLVPGRETEEDMAVELHIVLPKGGEADKEATQDEAEEDAQDGETLPQSLMEQEAEIAAAALRAQYGKVIEDRGQQRALTWRDMAVLLPKVKNVGKVVAATLQGQGIPVYSDTDEQYYKLPEIEAAMALLQVLDNPRQDMPLVTLLRSPIFALSDEDLAVIRLCAPQRRVPFYEAFHAACEGEGETAFRCREIADKIAQWREMAAYLPLDKLIWQLLWDTGLYYAAGAMASGEARQANLRMLCQRCADYVTEQRGNLHGFLLHGEKVGREGDMTTAKTLGEGEDVVRLMTIHKSKGLEFPVVAVLGLGDSIDKRQTGSPLRLHAALGMGLPYVRQEMRITRKTVAQQAIGLRQGKENRAERARLLYVAMTRAREKLILVGGVKRKSQVETWRLPKGPYRVLKAASMLDWICQALGEDSGRPLFAELEERGLVAGNTQSSTGYTHGETRWDIRVYPWQDQKAVEKEKDIHSLVESLLACRNRPLDEEIGIWMEADEGPVTAPAPLKTSVTSLTKERLWPSQYTGQEEETRDTKAAPEEITTPLRLNPLPALPAFLMEGTKGVITPAQAGTITHKALGCIALAPLGDLSGSSLRHALLEEIEALTQRGILTNEEKQAIRIEWIQDFFEGKVGKRLRRSEKVHREWPFILKWGEEKPVLIQGVVDCCFLEEGSYVLLDYKTDRVQHPEAAKERYETQLRLYSQAVEAITGITVKERALYLLRTGDVVQL